MPQKYIINTVRRSADPLLAGYFFNPQRIHTDYGGTRDGRFYSKTEAIACMNECYRHYLTRYEAALEDYPPVFDGHILIINGGIFTVKKA